MLCSLSLPLNLLYVPKILLDLIFDLCCTHPNYALASSLMGTGHQTHEKRSGLFFPCHKMNFGTWWFGGFTWHHLRPSSVLLNMRMALEIFSAGPSLMLMIFTMSVWVSSRKASPSIIYKRDKQSRDVISLSQLVNRRQSKGRRLQLLACEPLWAHQPWWKHRSI